jgi:hypothetical protein
MELRRLQSFEIQRMRTAARGLGARAVQVGLEEIDHPRVGEVSEGDLHPGWFLSTRIFPND